MAKEKLFSKETVISSSYHDELRRAIDKLEESRFDVAVAFYMAYTCIENGLKVWELLGYPSFKEYVYDEFGFEYRNAMYYVKIGENIVSHGIDKQTFDKIGWSKFKLIMGVLSSDLTKIQVEKLIKVVSKMSVRELKKFIDEKNFEKIIDEGNSVIEKVVRCKMVFTLTNEQADVVKQAINRAMEIGGLDNESMALELICVEYLFGEGKNANKILSETLEGSE